MPCRGLGPDELDRTVKIAAGEFTRHGTKSLRRHLAILAYKRLSPLTAAAHHEAAARAAARARRLATSPPRPHAQAAPGLSVPVGVAALIAWLLAAGSGSLLVLRRLARRPSLPDRSRGLRRPLPPVLIAHLGLALTGLLVWSLYLVTSWAGLAWAALGVLLPVAGLGMATLILGVPDPSPDRAPVADPGSQPSSTQALAPGKVRAERAAAYRAATDSAAANRAAADSGAADRVAADEGATDRTSLTLRDREAAPTPRTAGTRRPSRRPPVLLIAAHGALATATILLALLGAVAAVTSH